MANETVTDRSPDPLGTDSGDVREPGEPVPGDGESVTGDGEPVPGSGEPASGIAEKAPGIAEKVPGIAEPAPGIGEPIPEKAEPVPGIPELIAGMPKPAPAVGTPDALKTPGVEKTPDLPNTPDAPRRTSTPPARAAVVIGRTFARDMVVFFSVPVREVRGKKLMAIPATLVCVATIGVLWILELIRPQGLAFVLDVAGVRQGEPIWKLLPQLPLSLFAPAPDLPAWGAMTQVLIAFGIAECWLGWKRMIAIAMITSAVTSMAARVMVYASNWLHIGTPQIDNFQVDTGPSVAVVALLIYLALRLRTYWVVALTAVSMGGEAAILPNLAGREHLVAISLGIATYFLLDKWWPAWKRRRIERATSD